MRRLSIYTVQLALVFSFFKPRDSFFGVDKLKHFFVSAFIQSVSYSSLRAAGVEHKGSMAGAAGVTATFGVAREVYDGRVKGRFSGRDLVADAAGLTAGAVICNNTQR